MMAVEAECTECGQTVPATVSTGPVQVQTEHPSRVTADGVQVVWDEEGPEGVADWIRLMASVASAGSTTTGVDVRDVSGLADRFRELGLHAAVALLDDCPSVETARPSGGAGQPDTAEPRPSRRRIGGLGQPDPDGSEDDGRGDTPTDDFGSADTVAVPPKPAQSTAPAADTVGAHPELDGPCSGCAPADDPDPQDEVDRLGSVLFEVCRSAMLDPFTPADKIPRAVGRLARLASAAAPDVDTGAGWVARIPGPCWVVGDPDDDWEESHHPGQVAAEDQARRWELPGPVRQLDGECWTAARAGRLVVDDDIGVVHHRTEREARAAAGTAAPALSRDDLVDRFTAAVDNACDVAAIEIEVYELEPGPNGWQRSGQTSPMRRMVRALEGAGLLDETAIDEDGDDR